MNIGIQLLITILTTTTTPADGVGDLCDIVHRETGTPTICRPHREGAPIYDAKVCCAGDSCFPAAAGSGCRDGESMYRCELGELSSTGEVDCYFEVPDYCDLHPCDLVVSPGSTTSGAICCQWGVCVAITLDNTGCPIGEIYYCGSLVSNPDGTVSCIDWE